MPQILYMHIWSWGFRLEEHMYLHIPRNPSFMLFFFLHSYKKLREIVFWQIFVYNISSKTLRKNLFPLASGQICVGARATWGSEEGIWRPRYPLSRRTRQTPLLFKLPFNMLFILLMSTRYPFLWSCKHCCACVHVGGVEVKWTAKGALDKSTLQWHAVINSPRNGPTNKQTQNILCNNLEENY